MKLSRKRWPILHNPSNVNIWIIQLCSYHVEIIRMLILAVKHTKHYDNTISYCVLRFKLGIV